MIKILEKLEKAKVKAKLIEQNKWETFRRRKKGVTPKVPILDPTPATEDNNTKKRNELKRIDMEIAILRSQSFAKDSEVAEDIRELERQRSEIISGEKPVESLADILRARFDAIKQAHCVQKESQIVYEARRVCEKVRGNFQKDRNFYIKAVKTFPTTIDYLITTALEGAGKSSERYFAKMIAKKIREEVPKQ